MKTIVTFIIAVALWAVFAVVLIPSKNFITLTETYQQVPLLYERLKTQNIAIACKNGQVTYQGMFRVTSNIEGHKLGFVPDEVPSEQTCKVNDIYFTANTVKDVDMLIRHTTLTLQPQYEHSLEEAQQTSESTPATNSDIATTTHKTTNNNTQLEPTQPTTSDSPKVQVVTMNPSVKPTKPKVVALEQEISGQ